MDWGSWLPVIVSGIFVAFGAALWLWLRNVIKQFGETIEKGFRGADYYLEKWLGESNSTEAWKIVSEFGMTIHDKAELMIKTQSFQPSADNSGGNSGTITDVSKHLNK